jgi:hypothetical protein
MLPSRSSARPPKLGDVTGSVPRRRDRLIGPLLLGIAAVLLASSPTWFASGRTWVGGAQLFLALVVGGVGGRLYRRSTRTG